ncbi:hypothetical protein [Pseudidiomarina sp.]|uniref:hypothetical protein n=1 Tax=Pseudidiomarina sp. TaxID=2081707 RepID=UPI003A97A0F0
MMVYPLTLLLLSTPVVETAAVHELEQQLASVSALRVEELAELTAAAEVRKLQHQLQVAQLEAKIAEVNPRTQNQVTVTENPLSKLQVLGVIGIASKVRVWLQAENQAFFLGLDAPGPNGLTLVRNGEELALQQGQWRRELAVTETW